MAAVPLTSRIHEGLVFSNRDHRTLLDKLVTLLLSITGIWNRKVLLVADAYCGSGKLILALLSKDHQLVTRAKSNAVAYIPVPAPLRRLRGRPKSTGQRSASRISARTRPPLPTRPVPSTAIAM